MKSKFVVLSLVFCLLLSACSQARNEIPLPTETAMPTETPTDPPDPTEPPYSPPDYSHHDGPNEELYSTILGDPAKLKDGKPIIAAQMNAADWSYITFEGFDKKDFIWGYDVRSVDVSQLDFSVVENFSDISFDSDTIWPEELPEGFDPDYILEFNKNPGLGIRDLHERGITGENVAIAIIDQTLLTDHEQYKDNLMYYEHIHNTSENAAMHGPAVASIAVGKDVGVAPGAKLYYIASSRGHTLEDGSYESDASITADCILRILEINKHLPEDEKIRVISISWGFSSSTKGYSTLLDAIRKAKDENILVLTTSTDMYYSRFNLFGVDRNYLDDPDDPASYILANWISKGSIVRNPNAYSQWLLFPMGSRAYASSTGVSDYSISGNGGLSWAVPWCAGLYALCVQVKPDITPEEFIDLINAHYTRANFTQDDKTYTFGKIVNPAAVIDALQ